MGAFYVCALKLRPEAQFSGILFSQGSGEVEWNQRVTLKQVTLFWDDEKEEYDEKARRYAQAVKRGWCCRASHRGAVNLDKTSQSPADAPNAAPAGVGLQGPDSP